MQRNTQRLTEMLAPVIVALGYELVGVELSGSGANAKVLRVYIDHEGGIDVDDCGRVSHQVSGLLDVEDPIAGNYTLEVSSPGLDRPLFDTQHYERFAGHKVRIQLGAPLGGRRKFTGLLKGLQGTDVLVDVDGSEYSIPLASIDQARLVPEI